MAEPFDWNFAQSASDQILAEGLCILQSQHPHVTCNLISTYAGNYLISLDTTPVYVGEAGNLHSRIRQQFRESTSTFYKSYKKCTPLARPITCFSHRLIKTSIGRKEMEEMGIANLTCDLNRFQRDKRTKSVCSASEEIWHQIQQRHQQLLAEGASLAMKQCSYLWLEKSISPAAGLYIVRNESGEKILYIGESSDIRKRYLAHSSRTYFSALRRHVGTEILGFLLKVRNGKAKYFSTDEDNAVTMFLRSCQLATFPVSFGRFELEEHLIQTCRPLLNRKGNHDA